MAGCSNYFKELFLTEKNEYLIDIFNIKVVQQVIKYFYTGAIGNYPFLNILKIKFLTKIITYIFAYFIDINFNDINEILSIASLFQLEPLIKECFDFMKENINDENCLNILNQSQLHSATSTENDVMEYVEMRFKMVIDFLFVRITDFLCLYV